MTSSNYPNQLPSSSIAALDTTQFMVGDQLFEICPLTMGKGIVMAEICGELGVGATGNDHRTADGDLDTSTTSEICTLNDQIAEVGAELWRLGQHKPELLCRLAAVACLNHHNELTDREMVDNMTQYVKWNWTKDDFLMCLTTVFSMGDYMNLIDCLRTNARQACQG